MLVESALARLHQGAPELIEPPHRFPRLRQEVKAGPAHSVEAGPRIRHGLGMVVGQAEGFGVRVVQAKRETGSPDPASNAQPCRVPPMFLQNQLEVREVESEPVLPGVAADHDQSASAATAPSLPAVMQCIYNGRAVFDWDANNLRKIRAHRIKAEEVEKALSNDPIPIYEQEVEGEVRYVYYGETDSGRLLAVVLVERGETIRVVTAYDLDAGQKKDYLARRLQGE